MNSEPDQDDIRRVYRKVHSVFQFETPPYCNKKKKTELSNFLNVTVSSGISN